MKLHSTTVLISTGKLSDRPLPGRSHAPQQPGGDGQSRGQENKKLSAEYRLHTLIATFILCLMTWKKKKKKVDLTYRPSHRGCSKRRIFSAALETSYS